MSTLFQIIAASLAGGLLSMLAAALVTFGLPRHWLTRMVSFSIGILLATALLDLLPEAMEGGLPPDALFGWVLAGLLGFFLLEKLAFWRHAHVDDGDDIDIAAPMVVLGDAIHNISDGLVLAAAFLADPLLGWTTALAIIAHEVPQEAGDFALLLAAGWSRVKAFVWNGIASLTSVAGGIVGYFWLHEARSWTPVVLAVAAASFIYIAVSDLMPRLRRERGAFAWHGAFLGGGVGMAVFSIGQLHR